MVLLILPLSDAEHELLLVYDNLICVIFLIDFAMNITAAKPKGAYFFGRRGWLDLLGSIPTLGILSGRGAVPPGAPQPAGPHHPAAPRSGGQGPGHRCAQEP